MKYFKDRGQWRTWLKKNHDKEKEIWVGYYKKASGKQGLSYEEAVQEALCFGWIDGLEKSVDSERFMQRFTPRRPNSNWSLSNKKRVEKLIDEEKMTKAGLLAVEEAKKRGKW